LVAAIALNQSERPGWADDVRQRGTECALVFAPSGLGLRLPRGVSLEIEHVRAALAAALSGCAPGRCHAGPARRRRAWPNAGLGPRQFPKIRRGDPIVVFSPRGAQKGSEPGNRPHRSGT